MRTYLDLLRNRTVAQAVWVGLLIRGPMMGAALVVTLHVVERLGRGYGSAGVVTAVTTLALTVSSPWRGRSIDRRGLRRTIGPGLVLLAVIWAVVPWLGYWWLLAGSAVAGLWAVPVFSVIRQMMMQAVPLSSRTSVLALDSVAVEIAYAAGPVLGTLLATWAGTAVALAVCELATVLGGVVLFVVDPTLTPVAEARVPEDGEQARADPSWWRSAPVLGALLVAGAATVTLTGTELAVVADLRSSGQGRRIGALLAWWASGSAVGGLAYGLWHRPRNPSVLLAILGLTALPLALPLPLPLYLLALLVSGLACAPVITATVDALSRMVSPRYRGEVLGWHGSALTAGTALGAPLVGTVMDGGGPAAGFVLSGAVGVLVAGAVAVLGRRRDACP